MTGCIRPETLDRLNPDDGGGQYDSSGGDGGQGNPQGSKCTGFVQTFESHSFISVLKLSSPVIIITWNLSSLPISVLASSAAIISTTALWIRVGIESKI